MDLAALRFRARVLFDDKVQSEFASDELLTIYANRGVREACERAGLLFEITTLPLVAGQSTYQLDYEILAIAYAALPARTLGKLVPTDLDWLQTYSPSTGTPSCYAQREQFIELYPTPDAAATLTLKLYRYPLEDLVDDGDEPEIAPYHHDYIAHWMAYEALSAEAASADDAEARNFKKAEQQLALFTARFGRPRSATEIRSWRELPRHTQVKLRGDL